MSVKILFVSSEVYPLVKTGGLADVAGALPVALSGQHDLKVLLPAYEGVLGMLDELTDGPILGNPFGYGEMRLRFGRLRGCSVDYWLLDCPNLFHRQGGPYLNEDGQDHADNHRRFAALSWAGAVITQYGQLMNWRPDIVHAHDWQTGLLPAYLKAWAQRHPPVVYTIHNMQFTGAYTHEQYLETGLPENLFQMHGLEYFGRFSMLKAGIFYSDAVTTVSPTYAKEIQTPAYGCGLDALMRDQRHKLSGIMNGVDCDVWNPATDEYLDVHYSVRNLDGKAENKRRLQEKLGLEVNASRPMLGLVSRLSEQKGLDLVLQALPPFLEQGAQLVLLGSGDKGIESAYRALSGHFPRQVSATFGYNEALAHQIQAAADFLLVPSRFEPCGLTQLYALCYGTLPIVRRTGGLADSVWEDIPGRPQTGFVFNDATVWDFSAAIARAIAVHDNEKVMRQLREQAMQQDFSWESSAAQYLSLYKRLVT